MITTSQRVKPVAVSELLPNCAAHAPADTATNEAIRPCKQDSVSAGSAGIARPLSRVLQWDFNIYVHESNRGILPRTDATFLDDASAPDRMIERLVEFVRDNTTRAGAN